MSGLLLDLYTDYLICQNNYATATGLADLLPSDLSHDKVTRFLNGQLLDGKALWHKVKPDIRKHETNTGGVLILDDTLLEKPYTDENDIICWHHCHSKNQHIKGVNILSCLVKYNDVTLPVGYELVKKDVTFCELKTRKVRRVASRTKNEHCRELIGQAVKNGVLFEYVLMDNWFSSQENLLYINGLGKKFIVGLKSNRTVATSEDNRAKGVWQRVDMIDIQDGGSVMIWLKGLDFPLTLVKKVFKNKDNTDGILYLVSNDVTANADTLLQTYQKRWDIEVYHKSIKQNSSLAKSPTKRVRSQSNHICASIMAFCKLELLKVTTATNHFALKYKLIIASNIAAFKELSHLKKITNQPLLA